MASISKHAVNTSLVNAKRASLEFLTFSSVGVFLKEIVLMVSSSTSDFTIQKGILYLFATFCFTCFMGFGILNIKKI